MGDGLITLACLFGICGPSSASFDSLPLEQAIVYKHGNGTDRIAVFSDTDCEPCRGMHQEMAKLKDATVYVFLYPILSDDKQAVSRSVWCSQDRNRALNEVMAGATIQPRSCDAPIEKNLRFGRRLGIKSIPAMIAPNGKTRYGGRPITDLSEWIHDSQSRR